MSIRKYPDNEWGKKTCHDGRRESFEGCHKVIFRWRVKQPVNAILSFT